MLFTPALAAAAQSRPMVEGNGQAACLQRSALVLGQPPPANRWMPTAHPLPPNHLNLPPTHPQL